MAATDVYDLIQTSLLGEAVENVPLGIFVADDEMNYIAVNRRACDLLGYTRDELLDMSVSDVSPSPISREMYRDMIAAGDLLGNARLVRKDGEEIDVEFWAYSTRVAQMLVYISFVRPT